MQVGGDLITRLQGLLQQYADGALGLEDLRVATGYSWPATDVAIAVTRSAEGGVVEFAAADRAETDVTLLVDQVGCWYRLDAIFYRDVVLPEFSVVELRPGDLVGLDIFIQISTTSV